MIRPAEHVDVRVTFNHTDAVLPKKANPTDAGFDLWAVSGPTFEGGYIEYDTGLSIELPPGYSAEVRPRSSISKYDLVLANSVGTIDNGYRGSILVRFKPSLRITGDGTIGIPTSPRFYEAGDRICQLVIYKDIEAKIVQTPKLTLTTDRGTGGFGSSGT